MGGALVAAGADVNAAESSRGQTALMWAVAQGHDDVAAVLVCHGADVEARSKVRPRMMHAESTNGSQYDQGVVWNRGGFTPLLFAARHGRVAAAGILLDGGADVENPAPTGAAPLALAALSGQGELAALWSSTAPIRTTSGRLHRPARRRASRRPALVRTLLAHGADPNLRLRAGTPVRRASQDWAFAPPWSARRPTGSPHGSTTPASCASSRRPAPTPG